MKRDILQALRAYDDATIRAVKLGSARDMLGDSRLTEAHSKLCDLAREADVTREEARSNLVSLLIQGPSFSEIEDALDKALDLRAVARAKECDAGACQTSRDWDAFHAAEDRAGEAKDALLSMLRKVVRS
jgi:hypothetical protein